jgi:hypothetical protein
MHFIPKRDRALEKHLAETPESPAVMNVQSRKDTSIAIMLNTFGVGTSVPFYGTKVPAPYVKK